jgi:hypothetical protein
MISRLIPVVLGGLLSATILQAAEMPTSLSSIKKDIFFLAGEECEGRGVETQGILKAGEYIADTYRKAGLRPGGPDNSYFQNFQIAGPTRLGKPNSLSVTNAEGKVEELSFNSDFMPVIFSPSGKKSAGVVFVGYGLANKALKYDDYADVDVEGKFVVILRKTPNSGKPNNLFDTDMGQAASLGGKLETAIQKKAGGVIFVSHYSDEKSGDTLMPFGYGGGGATKVPVHHIKRSVLAKWLEAEGKKLSDIEKTIEEKVKPNSFELKGLKVNSEVTVDRSGVQARNVIGVSEGSGPLADETIVVGAHYDHLGKGEPGSLAGANGRGKVHYGADDNGSGTTCLLELARRYGAMPNRFGRRIVFIAFSGEERGLLGSVHYCKEPTFPLSKTVMMLNMDMVGRVVKVLPKPTVPAELAKFELKLETAASVSGLAGVSAGTIKDRLVIYGTGSGDSFDNTVTNVNKIFDFHLLRIPSGSGPSDHDSFYRRQVPVLFFFTGLHAQYHRPQDVPELINIDGIKRVADISEVLLSQYSTTVDRPKYQVTRGGFEDPTEERRPAQPKSPRSSAPKMGIMPGNYESTDGGVLVEGVSPGGAAEKAGLKSDDIIVQIAGKPVKNIETYMSIMASQKAGVEIEVVVMRKDKKVTVKVTPIP